MLEAKGGLLTFRNGLRREADEEMTMNRVVLFNFECKKPFDHCYHFLFVPEEAQQVNMRISNLFSVLDEFLQRRK